jgi:hypoxanthine phosphoribosyltransferase
MTALDEINKVQAEAEQLYSRQQVEAAMDRIAGRITEALAAKNPLVLTVLNGGIPFAGQLLTRLPFPLELDSIQATRYRGSTTGAGISWLHEPVTSMVGRVVLIVDDILDEGVTLAEIVSHCRDKGAAEVFTAVLVEKDLGKPKPCQADFVALKTPDRYLFGYGMDYKHYLRNAAGIYACKDL